MLFLSRFTMDHLQASPGGVTQGLPRLASDLFTQGMSAAANNWLGTQSNCLPWPTIHQASHRITPPPTALHMLPGKCHLTAHQQLLTRGSLESARTTKPPLCMPSTFTASPLIQLVNGRVHEYRYTLYSNWVIYHVNITSHTIPITKNPPKITNGDKNFNVSQI